MIYGIRNGGSPYTHSLIKGIPTTQQRIWAIPHPLQTKMDDGDSENYLIGNVNRRLIFSSQLSQGVESSQRGNPIISQNSIDKSLDVRLLSQMDFYTPAVSVRS